MHIYRFAYIDDAATYNGTLLRSHPMKDEIGAARTPMGTWLSAMSPKLRFLIGRISQIISKDSQENKNEGDDLLKEDQRHSAMRAAVQQRMEAIRDIHRAESWQNKWWREVAAARNVLS